jgi:hypothetical protein
LAMTTGSGSAAWPMLKDFIARATNTLTNNYRAVIEQYEKPSCL